MPDNDFTATNLAASDVVLDNPSAGSNFCTLNPLDISRGTLSEGNTKYTATTSTWGNVRSTFAASTGKWYWEVTATTVSELQAWVAGILEANQPLTNDYWWSSGWNCYGVMDDSYKVTGSAAVAFSNGIVSGSVIGFRLDLDHPTTTTLAISVNGVDKGTMFSILTDTEYSPALCIYGDGGAVGVADMNFGQGDPNGNNNYQDGNGKGNFKYEPPSGYLAWCTNTLTASIAKPAENFDVLTYASSGAKTFDNGTTTMQPDLVWVKARGDAYDHELTDSVRGVTKALSSNDTGAESTDSTGLTAFGSDGFTVGAGTNYSTSSMVAWAWKAGTDGMPAAHTYALTLALTDSSDDGWGDGSYVTPRLKVYEDRGSGNVLLGYATVADGESSASYTINTNNKLAIEIIWDYDDSGSGDPPDSAGYPNEPAGTLSDGATTMATWDAGDPDVSDGATFIAKTSGQTATGIGTLTSAGGVTGSSYNAAAGFSIQTWTGNDPDESAVPQEVDHHLGVVPEMIIAKSRTDNSGYTDSWYVHHKDLTSGDIIALDDSGSAWTPSARDPFGTITSTNVGFRDSYYEKLNYEDDDYVGYFFASVEGYSKCGFYTGNGLAAGPMVTLSFRPAFILTKRIDDTSPWRMFDDKRPTYNGETYKLEADSSGAELTGYPYVDFLSNGFKIRDNGSYQNASGGKYIFYAVGQSSKYASAR